MFPSKLGLFAHLALVANAILIPPSISIDEFGDDHALETLVINPSKRSVAIECPGCPLATAEGDKLSWTPDVGNAFSLEFEVGLLQDNILIDEVQLYPPTYFGSSFYVTQVNPKPENNIRLRVTGYQFHYNSAETISEAGMELLPMNFQITSVEGVPMKPQALTVNVLKDAEGRLMIASLQTLEVEQPNTNDEKKDCNEWPLLCKWKNILGDKLKGPKKPGKGCHRPPHGPPHGHPPMEEDDTMDQPPYRPHHGKHHGPHHGGHRHPHGHHRVRMFLRRAFFTVLVPVLIGIFAGTLTYLIGMALGCLIAIIVAKFRGQTYQKIATEEEEEEDVESEVGGEKEEYAELPAYDAPPNYEDGVEKEDTESK